MREKLEKIKLSKKARLARKLEKQGKHRQERRSFKIYLLKQWETTGLALN